MTNTQLDPLDHSYADRMHSLITDVGMPLNLAPKALGLTSSEFIRWWSSHDSRVISRVQFSNLSDYLCMDEDLLYQGNYDKSLIRSRIIKGPTVLPEKYSSNQFSNLRSSAHIIKYLQITRGQHFVDRILTKLNVSPLIYSDMNTKISLNYFIDLLQLLSENGVDQNELDSLAGVLFLTLSETDLGQQFKNAKNYYQCYSVLAQNLSQFDENFVYSSELTSKEFRLTAFLPFEKHTQIDWKQCQIDKLLRYRKFLAGWFPYLSKLPPIIPKVELTNRPDGLQAVYVIDFGIPDVNQLFSLADSEI